MFHSTHTHATPGLCRRTLQCGWFPFALSLFYSTYSKRGGVTKIFSLSDPHPDKCFDIFDMVSDIPSGSIFGIYIYTLYSGIIYSDILSDILSGFLSFFFDIPCGILSGIHSGILSGIYSDILSGLYSDILSCIFSAIHSGIYLEFYSGTLSGIFFDILSDTGTAGPETWGSRLRSGSAR